MKLSVSKDKKTMGQTSADSGAATIRRAIEQRGEANIILATGASQFQTLEALVQQEDIAWEKVTGFHLDEYVGLAITHPASFRMYLWKRFVSLLPRPLRAFHYLDAEDDPRAEADRVGGIIAEHPIDAAFVGIGENGHLAFNDPPANFDTDQPYLVVDLDEKCRKQQLGEGWFDTLEDVPKRAVSMSIRQIMKAGHVVCTVPDQRKAWAVQRCVEGEVTNQAPASVLQQHDHCELFLDKPAASRLKQNPSK